jgi:DNA-binding NtrC family response regulator
MPIIFVTGHGDIPMTVQAMKAGAVEFLTKPFRDQELLDAIAQAIGRDRAERQQRADLAALHQRYNLLTPREREVMHLVVSGRLNKQIAADLGTSEITIKTHRFVRHYAQRLRKRIDIIPAEALEALTGYHWPGNVRELQNLIESAVILTPDTVLRLPSTEWQRSRTVLDTPPTRQTLEEVERAHIFQVLRDTNWVIGGPQGAAARLGVCRTTLRYRMEKLGISRRPA